MRRIIIPALRATLVTWLLCGVAYPLTVTALGQWLLPYQANGSLVRDSHGAVIGSRLIGQYWTGAEWFHGRPSATTAVDPADPNKTLSAPYNASSSGGSNLGPISANLARRIMSDRKRLEQEQPELAGRRLPADMLTASGSGLDPDISPASAQLQAPRVAAARRMTVQQVMTLVARHTSGRVLGLFGEPRVNVLELNLDLQASDRRRGPVPL